MDDYLLSKYIASVYRYSKNQINRQISNLDIRATQGDLLLFIDEHPHLSQKQIAQGMHIDPSLLGRDLVYLENRQLVERVVSKRDSRVKEIMITSQGHQTAAAVRQQMNEWWTNFFHSHSKIAHEELMQQLRTCFQAIEEEIKHEDH